MEDSTGDAGAVFIREVRSTLQLQSRRILNCLEQLKENDLLWRPCESHNTVQMLMLHLCGSTQQWICAGVGGAPDRRNRPAEFSECEPIPKAQLMAMLREMVADADSVLASLSPSRLAEPCRVQGFELTVMGAILDSVTHLVGHTYQIVYITRILRGDSYRFFWTPQTPEQISAMPEEHA